MKRISFFAVAVCGALSAAPAHADFSVLGVTMTDLGTLGGQVSEAYDVNDAGTIVGYSIDSLRAWRAFHYTDGVMYHVTIPASDSSWALGINNLGQIVGNWRDSTGEHAYRWHSGFFEPLEEGAPFFETVESSAIAIADTGRTVGQLKYPRPLGLGFSAANMWPTPASQHLLYPSLIPEEFSAYVRDVDELSRAVLWDARYEKSYLVNPFGPFATMFREVPPPPPVAGYEFEYLDALGLHENNGVVGTALYSTPSDYDYLRAYYWNTLSRNVTLLPQLTGGWRSVADDINGQGLIAGWSQYAPSWTSEDIHEVAFIYHADFGMYALPRGLFHTCHARALNERNQEGIVYVVGWCEGTKGRSAIRWNVRIKGNPRA